MLEIYVLVEKKKSLVFKLLSMLCLVIAGYFIYMTFMISVIFVFISIPFLLLAWFFYNNKVEFEYSYFDGDVRFAKIFNKQRRRDLKGYDMENVIVLAPKGDRSLHQYEKNPKVKVRDLTSGNEGARIYCVVAKTEERYEMTAFEPDDKYLDAVCMKYRQKVVR